MIVSKAAGHFLLDPCEPNCLFAELSEYSDNSAYTNFSLSEHYRREPLICNKL